MTQIFPERILKTVWIPLQQIVAGRVDREDAVLTWGGAARRFQGVEPLAVARQPMMRGGSHPRGGRAKSNDEQTGPQQLPTVLAPYEAPHAGTSTLLERSSSR